ncbi:hypothetical protein D3C75_470590 [compost metagenome]
MSLVPSSWSGQAAAAAKDLEVTFGAGTHIGNLSYAADNALLNFYNNQTAGFVTKNTRNTTINWMDGDVLITDDDGGGAEFELDISKHV